MVISRASADCKRQSVLRADGYGGDDGSPSLRALAQAAMFSNKGLLFIDMRKIF